MTHRRRNSIWKDRGFTLIELLVVVAIIALLISILLPSLKRAREQARMATCLASLKGLATASNVYATGDKSEMSIPTHPLMFGPASEEVGAVGEVEYGGRSGRGEPTINGDPTSSVWGTQNGRGPATRGLNPILYKTGFTDYIEDSGGVGNPNWISDMNLDLGIFSCPGDDGFQNHHREAWANSGLTSYDHYGTSYAAGASWIGTSIGAPLYSNSSFLRPISRVPNPANTAYFIENVGRYAYSFNYGADGCTRIGGAQADLHDKPMKGWHGRAFWFSTAFVDAHAAMVSMQGHTQPQPRLSNYPDFAGSGTNWEFWHCVIFRGDGWQLDTLPAPPVRTPINASNNFIANNPVTN